MRNAIIIFALLSLFCGLVLLWISFSQDIGITFIIFLLLGIGAIIAAIKYTIGKSAYGYSGLGDLFVFLFFGIVGVLGTYYLQTHEIQINILLPASTFGLLSVAVLNLNNMRDIENDAKVGKRTLVVMLGSKKAKYYHASLFIWAYAALAVFLYDLGFLVKLIPMFAAPIFALHILHVYRVFRTKEPKDLDPMLKVIALSTFLLSLILSFCIYQAFGEL